MKYGICNYKYNSLETEQIELHLVRTHSSVVVQAGNALKTWMPAKNDICNMSFKNQSFQYGASDRCRMRSRFGENKVVVVVVLLLFYIHGRHLRSCWNGQLT